MATFDTYSSQLESAIDTYFSEDVQLLPYKEATGYLTGSQPDSSRPVVTCTGYVVSKGSAMRAPAGSFISRRLDADFLIRVRPEYLAQIEEHDRVKFLDAKRNNLVCEISFIEPSANGRPVLHLIKVRS